MTKWQVQVAPAEQAAVAELHGTPLQHCELVVHDWP